MNNLPHNGTATSYAAAQAIAPHAQTILEQVYQYVFDQRTQGATINEVSRGTGIAEKTVCARFDDLKKKGRIFPADCERKTESGRSAAVWVAREFFVKLQRKKITAHAANLAEQGVTPNDLRRVFEWTLTEATQRLNECADLALVSRMAAEIREGQFVCHVTARGLAALGFNPENKWHVDRAATTTGSNS